MVDSVSPRVHVAVGYTIGSWWAIALAPLVPVVSIPAGDAEPRDTPVFAVMFYFIAGFAALLAIGVVLGRRRSERA